MKFILVSSFLLLVCLFFYSCTPKSYTDNAYRIIHKFSDEVNDGLQPFGIGGHFFEKINKFSLDYIAYKKEMNLNEARRILVESAELLFCLVNEDEEIRPYLKYYPYTEKHVYLALSFVNHSYKSIQPPNVAMVSLTDGRVLYDEYSTKYELIFEETYAEAYEKVYGIPFPEERMNAE